MCTLTCFLPTDTTDVRITVADLERLKLLDVKQMAGNPPVSFHRIPPYFYIAGFSQGEVGVYSCEILDLHDNSQVKQEITLGKNHTFNTFWCTWYVWLYVYNDVEKL